MVKLHRPRKPFVVSKKWEVGYFMFFLPGLLLSVVILLVGIAVLPGATLIEEVKADAAWMAWAIRSVAGVTVGLGVYSIVSLLAGWHRDGYIDAILAPSQRLQAQWEKEKERP